MVHLRGGRARRDRLLPQRARLRLRARRHTGGRAEQGCDRQGIVERRAQRRFLGHADGEYQQSQELSTFHHSDVSVSEYFRSP